MNRTMRLITILPLLVVCSSFWACAEPEPEITIIAEPPQPQLATARDPQFNMFGEIPARPDSPFFSRSASSITRHTAAEEGADFDPDLSRDNKYLVFSSTRHSIRPDLYYKTVDGTAVTQLTSDPSSDVQPAFSPDGKWIAFASDRSGNWDIWIINVDGTQPIQVTRGIEDEVHPSWSPDGKTLVFSSLPRTSGQWELWIADATAGATKQFIGYGLFPTWCPTDNTIAYQRSRQRGSRWFSIWTIKLVDGEPRYPTEIVASADYAAISPAWSPNGKQLTYCTVAIAPPSSSDYASTNEIADIWTVDVNGRGRIRLTDGHSSNYGPAWSTDNRIFFTSTRDGFENIWSMQPEGDTVTEETNVGDVVRRDDNPNING